MAWWEKGLKSVQDSAAKMSFEAEKLVRVNREQAAAGQLRTQVQEKLADLGRIALDLHRRGGLSDPNLEALALEIEQLETQLAEQEAKVEAVRAEQYASGVPEPQAPPSGPPVPATPPEPAPGPTVPIQVPPVPTAPPERPLEQPELPVPAQPAPATQECPNCHAQVRATAAFCPECGSRLK